MSVEALLGTDVAFAAAYQLARPHPGQVAGRRGAAAPAARQRPAAGAPRPRPQGPGPVLAALRAAGPRRGARRPRPPAPGPRHRAQLRDRQPARLPRRRRRRRGHHRDRRRPGHQRRQLPRRADRAGARLRQAGHGRARLDQRTADRAARGPSSERRAAAVPGAVVGRRVRDDDLPVHGGGPRLASTRSSPTRRRSIRSRRRPTRRTTSRWGRSRRVTPGRC